MTNTAVYILVGRLEITTDAQKRSFLGCIQGIYQFVDWTVRVDEYRNAYLYAIVSLPGLGQTYIDNTTAWLQGIAYACTQLR